MKDAERLALAARVRDACVAAALAGHEEAAIAGKAKPGGGSLLGKLGGLGTLVAKKSAK